MDKNVIDIDDFDTPIYRIYSMNRFVSLIKEQKNGLVNPSKWDDPFENFFLKNKAVTPDGELVSLENISNKWYGQCWTKNKDSDAMWRIYSQDKKGIRVATTVRKLFSNFYNHTDSNASLKYLIGAVSYADRSEIEEIISKTTFMDLALGGQPHNFARTLCIKRREFEHENEVRLLFQDSDPAVGSDGVATFSFDSDKIIDEVALDPRLNSDEVKTVRDEFEKININAPIIQSDLYQITPTTIRLGN